MTQIISILHDGGAWTLLATSHAITCHLSAPPQQSPSLPVRSRPQSGRSAPLIVKFSAELRAVILGRIDLGTVPCEEFFYQKTEHERGGAT